MYALQKREKEILALLGEAGDKGMNNVEVAKVIDISKFMAEIFLNLLFGSRLANRNASKNRYYISQAGIAYLGAQKAQESQPAQLRFEL